MRPEVGQASDIHQRMELYARSRVSVPKHKCSTESGLCCYHLLSLSCDNKLLFAKMASLGKEIILACYSFVVNKNE
jgi:hypothetical protein